MKVHLMGVFRRPWYVRNSPSCSRSLHQHILDKEMTESTEYVPLEKAPEHALIFACSECGTRRMYGRVNLVPANKTPLLVCNGKHKAKKAFNQVFPHVFVGIVRGGEIHEKEN